MSLPRDDLDLIDALVYCGAISRATAKEVAATAKPGRVATCIMERGLNNACGPSYVIVERLARAEFESASCIAAALSAGDLLIKKGISLSEIEPRPTWPDEQPETD
jgi:hypothetical protein